MKAAPSRTLSAAAALAAALLYALAPAWHLTEPPSGAVLPTAGGVSPPDASVLAKGRGNGETPPPSPDTAEALAHCALQQRELTFLPGDVIWPGFHALCVLRADERLITVRAIVRATGELRTVSARTVPELLLTLKPILESNYGDDDRTITAADYEFPPHPWALFSPVGDRLEQPEQLRAGGLACVYEGGAFIWPGWHIGHKTTVDVPLFDPATGLEARRPIELTTLSLRPLVLELSGFLTEEECDWLIAYAQPQLVRSQLAHMDGSDKGSDDDVRTSTQLFVPRGGSAQIRRLEERAHNLTRLAYSLGENIQVLRYRPAEKYGAHRDFFSANDYHAQPAMLRSVEYGARNRMATVFWYMSSVAQGGETYFPRALNAAGQEYHPWNGDHNDCYRGIAVKPTKGNAVLFYSMLPDGRLDERSLHGGCPPRGEGEQAIKWGANQWIWNQPHRFGAASFPRKRRAAAAISGVRRPGCADASPDCAAWAAAGECAKNPAYMLGACPVACDSCPARAAAGAGGAAGASSAE